MMVCQLGGGREEISDKEDTGRCSFTRLGDTEVGGKEDVQVSDLINWMDGSSDYTDQEP